MRNIDLKYFLYARKSSESEDRQMASIEDQLGEVKKLADELNIKIVDVIKESKSAKEPGRTGFNGMLQRIHKGEAQGILTWKLNRLARNPVDGGQISWMLQQNIIKHIQTVGRDYRPTDNVLMMQVEFGMANQYVKDLSVDVKRGMRRKAERGWYPTTKIPMGYMHNNGYRLGIDDENIPDPERFHIVKKLWKFLLTGNYSIADIKRKGDAMGLRNKKGKEYSIHTYHKALTNEFYCGYFHWKDENGNSIRHRGKHKVMISPTEFQRVQIILRNRSKHKARKRKYNFPYRGLISCGECGGTITPDHKLQAVCRNCKFKYSIKTETTCPRCNTELTEMKNPTIVDILYYHCTKRKGKCSQGSIRRDEIEETIENELKEISINKDFHNWALDVLKNEKRDDSEEKNLIRKLKKKKTELENRLDSLIKMRADDEIDSKTFNSSTKKTQKELSLLEMEIDEMEQQQINWLKNTKKDYDFALHSLKTFKNGDDTTKTKIVKGLCSNLKLLDKRLCFTTKKAFLEVKELSTPYVEKSSCSNPKKALCINTE